MTPSGRWVGVRHWPATWQAAVAVGLAGDRLERRAARGRRRGRTRQRAAKTQPPSAVQPERASAGRRPGVRRAAGGSRGAAGRSGPRRSAARCRGAAGARSTSPDRALLDEPAAVEDGDPVGDRRRASCRSWAMITTARPRSWRSRSSRRSTRLRLDTSSALTGSSQNSSRGPGHDRAGERDPLPLAAGELARVAGRGPSRRRGRPSASDSSTRWHALAPRRGRRRRRAARPTSSADGEVGVERAQRVLEDELHLSRSGGTSRSARPRSAPRSRALELDACRRPGATSPTVARASVVLPEPVSPTMPTISPGGPRGRRRASAAPVPR